MLNGRPDYNQRNPKTKSFDKTAATGATHGVSGMNDSDFEQFNYDKDNKMQLTGPQGYKFSK